MRITLPVIGMDLAEFMKKLDIMPSANNITAVWRGKSCRVTYDEYRPIYVLAWGHMHYKSACKQIGADWRRCMDVHWLTALERTAIHTENTLVLVHETAKDLADYDDMLQMIVCNDNVTGVALSEFLLYDN